MAKASGCLFLPIWKRLICTSYYQDNADSHESGQAPHHQRPGEVVQYTDNAIMLRWLNYVSSKIQINGDINALVQVIDNMISNSIQSYNGKTNQVIDLTLRTNDSNLLIEIQDYGCGMTNEVKDKLFKQMITTKGKKGTGLGLFMSYSTIKAHFNGDIKFESEHNKGTTFTIILPLS